VEVDMTSRIGVALLAVLLAGCGSGGGSTTTATPPTTMAPCMQTVLFQGSSAVASGTGVLQDFTVTSTVTTRLDVTVDWTSAASAIGVYVTQGTCSPAQLNAGACTFFLRSDPSLMKPRRVTGTVAPGGYTFVIANLGAFDESVSAQLVLSSATCPPLASAGAPSALSGRG
jgi:hypothetical protein